MAAWKPPIRPPRPPSQPGIRVPRSLASAGKRAPARSGLTGALGGKSLSADSVKAEIWRGIEAKMNAIGAAIMGEAQRNAPVEEGTLRASATFEVENTAAIMPRDGSRISLTIRFPVPYALVQHERLDFSHPKGGGSKYLENAVKAFAPRLERALAGKGIGLTSSGSA